MDKSETLAVQLKMIFEYLQKLGDGNNEQLPGLEKYVQGEICALLDAEASLGEHFMKVHMASVPEEKREMCDKLVQYSGSIVEGAMMARCFQLKENWKEVEVDIMGNLFTIQQEVSHLLEPVEDKLGFVRLPFCQELCTDFHTEYAENYLGISEDVPHSVDQMPQYFSPLIVKNFFSYEPLLSRLLDIYLAELLGDVINTKTVSSSTETTIEVKLDYNWNCINGSIMHFSMDIVPAGNLLFWPNQAATWITRQRIWPQQDTIQRIVDKGCHVVPRSSPGGDVHTEWRLSFSGPEAILAQMRSKEQQQAYYFFKMFFYRYLKCVESSEPERKPLYSYIIKTTMLWACEELPPEDPIWACLEESVQMLLFKLLGSLEAGFLCHYFIPEINLLERVGEDVRNKCAAFINRWQSNILMTAPFDMLEKRKFINLLRSLFSLGYENRSVLGSILQNYF